MSLPLLKLNGVNVFMPNEIILQLVASSSLFGWLNENGLVSEISKSCAAVRLLNSSRQMSLVASTSG